MPPLLTNLNLKAIDMTMCSKKTVATKMGQAVVISDNESIRHQTDNEKKMGASVSKHIPLSIPLLPLFMTTKRQSERDTYFESTYAISILENDVLEDVFTVQDK